MDTISEFMQRFRTDQLVATIQDLKLGDLIHNPWFLGSVLALAILALIMRWKVLLTTILGISGFVWLVNYTLERGTNLDSASNPTLLVFVGGGAVIIGLVIYLLFIKTD